MKGREKKKKKTSELAFGLPSLFQYKIQTTKHVDTPINPQPDSEFWKKRIPREAMANF